MIFWKNARMILVNVRQFFTQSSEGSFSKILESIRKPSPFAIVFRNFDYECFGIKNPQNFYGNVIEQFD